MKIAFCTLGCKVNQYETEAIKEIFIKNNWEIGDFNDICDAYLINTCSVTSLSDRKSRQMIRQAVRKNKNAVVCVCGCYAQAAPEEIEKIEGVNIIIGTKNKTEAYDLITKEVNANIVTPLTDKDVFEETPIACFKEKTRAILKIQDGCNNFCSYCIIPYTRGRIRSRDPKNIYDECVRLAKSGFNEIVLSGIHVCSYGKDMKDYNLTSLINLISGIKGLERIRLSSIEPLAFDNEFLEMLKVTPNVCHHFHISLQSGCDETLKRMNRRYKASFYKEVCDNLIKIHPDTAVTTDVIVGFPGETEEEFNKTVEFLNSVPFYKIHTFKYSVRPGTRAALMENQISPEIKEKRSKVVIEISNRKQKEFEEKYIGKEVSILLESIHKDGFYCGHTSNYLPVYVKSDEDLIGKFKDVKIIKRENKRLIGEFI